MQAPRRQWETTQPSEFRVAPELGYPLGGFARALFHILSQKNRKPEKIAAYFFYSFDVLTVVTRSSSPLAPRTRLVARSVSRFARRNCSVLDGRRRCPLTVRDSGTGRPVFAKWQPNRFRGSDSDAGSPPMRLPDPVATLTRPCRKASPRPPLPAFLPLVLRATVGWCCWRRP